MLVMKQMILQIKALFLSYDTLKKTVTYKELHRDVIEDKELKTHSIHVKHQQNMLFAASSHGTLLMPRLHTFQLREAEYPTFPLIFSLSTSNDSFRILKKNGSFL